MSDHLGTFEQLCMLAIMRLGEGAYGAAIVQQISTATGRDVVVASVSTTLRRLDARGFVASRMGERTPERGGRRKRYYRLTAAGIRALNDTSDALDRMWAGSALPAGA